MAKTIPIALAQAPWIEVDGALVAQGLGLELQAFRQLMDERKIAVLCERGTGEDEGLHRASFYYGTRRVRMVLDREGGIVPGSCIAGDMPTKPSL